MHSYRHPVLVLNGNFEPIHITHMRRAVNLVLKGSAIVEESYDQCVHSGRNWSMPIPSVIRLCDYRKIPHYHYTLSRKNVLLRDRYVCQYCHKKFQSGDLTLDHVKPKSQGGTSSWDNLVTCCRRCNHHKGSRTPEEANMKLLSKPRAAGALTNRMMLRVVGQDNEAWQKYLFF